MIDREPLDYIKQPVYTACLRLLHRVVARVHIISSCPRRAKNLLARSPVCRRSMTRSRRVGSARRSDTRFAFPVKTFRTAKDKKKKKKKKQKKPQSPEIEPIEPIEPTSIWTRYTVHAGSEDRCFSLTWDRSSSISARLYIRRIVMQSGGPIRWQWSLAWSFLESPRASIRFPATERK